ncbi:TPA: hypothetical protein JBL23_16805 [Legionella pneumophila]|nr:hypothetical protein [Legionella pneumophila subsp. fraseri]MDW9063572.1 hypothetical protein [Legionella pneumophila subsp. fraseri]HAU2308160.1 hypothetical protein [Legionella pneumophila]HAU2309762.1 hypothetical protein [Legionella pneumophila]
MIKKIPCYFGFHKFYLEKELTRWLRKIGCRRCGKFYVMNDNLMAVLPWDEDFEKIYKALGCL